MLRDSSTVPAGATLKTDLCICGAGAAGISLALEMAGSGQSIVVLEGGGTEFEPASQQHYEGKAPPPMTDSYMVSSRLRYLGGTTNHWLGWCGRLFDSDFETRAWVPHSGWPIAARDVAPYYERALRMCGIEGELAHEAPIEEGSDAPVRTIPFRIKQTRFGPEYRGRLAEQPNLDVILHANVVRLRLHPDGRTLRRVEVARDPVTPFTVEAKRFVLACGTLENARLLLASDDVHSSGVGNRFDQVGRYLMEHPVYTGVEACATDGGSPFCEPRPRPDTTWSYRLSDELLEREGLLQCGFNCGQLEARPDGRPIVLEQGRWDSLERHVASAGAGLERTADQLAARPAKLPLLFHRRFAVRPEQSPDPDNRLLLSTARDAFGTPQAELKWRLTDFDKRSTERSFELLARLSGSFGWGRLALVTGAPLTERCEPGFHPAGTTRMHDDPKRGVVNGDCRLHEVENLFIAGGSVFPTSGTVNPTLTLVALAIRLADHFKASAS